MKALAGLLDDQDDDDDLFFAGSVKAKQQFIIEKLSKNTPIKDNQQQLTPQRQQQQQQSPLRQGTSYHHEQQVSKEDVQPSNTNISNNNNANNSEEGVKFGGESADETSSFVSASVRERAAAMSGFLTKKHDGPTNGQARAMEWRVDGSGGGSGGGTQREVTPKKIAPNFVSKFDKVAAVGGSVVEENEVNGGSTTTPKNHKKKSRPSFLSQFDDSPRTDNKLDEATGTSMVASPRRPLTPRTSLAPSPRTSSYPTTTLLSSPRCPTPRSRTPKSDKSNLILSPRTPRTQQSPGNNSGSSSSRVLPSPRMSSQAVLNCSTAAEAGNITQEIDDWFGGMSLSASTEEGGEEKEKKEERNNDDDHDGDGGDAISLSGSEGSTDLDNLISEANGFLEGVASQEENVDTMIYFGFHDDNDGGDKDDDVASAGVNSNDIESELESALQLAQGFTKFLTHDSDEGSTSPVASNVVDDNCGWRADNHVEKEERHDEEKFVRELALDEAAGEGEEEEEQEEEEQEEKEQEKEIEGEADWEGWNKNNDFFASFDEKQEEEEEVTPQIEEPEIKPHQEYSPRRSFEADLPNTEPKLRVHIKGVPQVLPEKEGEESMFFAASQPSPLARDDEQLLDTNDVESMVMPSPVSVESESPKTEKSPKKFGLRISGRGGGGQESEEKIVEKKTSQEDELSPFSQWNKPKEMEKNVPNTPPKLTVYIKGAPQFTPSRNVQEDAFYMSQPSPVFGDDKRLLSSSSFAASPSMAEQKNEKTSMSTTKNHFRNFVGKSLPVPKYQATANKKGNSLNSPSATGLIKEQEDVKFDQGSALNIFNDKSENEGFGTDNFFFAAPTSPLRQAKDAIREGCSAKKKIFGLLSGKKKKNKGLYLLDD